MNKTRYFNLFSSSLDNISQQSTFLLPSYVLEILLNTYRLLYYYFFPQNLCTLSTLNTTFSYTEKLLENQVWKDNPNN